MTLQLRIVGIVETRVVEHEDRLRLVHSTLRLETHAFENGCMDTEDKKQMLFYL